MTASFKPPERLLLGPGPSNVAENVRLAMAQVTIGHLDPAFIGMMDELKALLQYAFQTTNSATFAISAPGSAGMECCIVNLLEPGDTAVICVNGVFGKRMVENVERCGAKCVVVSDEWGEQVDLDKLEQALRSHSEAKLVGFVHAETSTGVRSDAEAIAALAKKYNCLAVMDCVTSLGGIEVAVDKWQIDAAYSGTQKCLSAPPGLSPVTFSAAAVEKIKNRKTSVNSWFLDLRLLLDYWEGAGPSTTRVYHHTAPVNALYGLHQALVNLKNEGLQSAWSRHQSAHALLVTELEALGLEFVVQQAIRLPELNLVSIPECCHDAETRAGLLNKFGIEIGSGLGHFAGKVWRIGLMGENANPSTVVRLTDALKNIIVTNKPPA